MTKDEALKLALEKFEFMNHVDSIFEGEFDFQINAIKEALAQPEPMRLRRGDILRCIETDELCTVWSTSTTGKTLIKWGANDFGGYTAEQIGELFWLEPSPDDLELAAEKSDNYAAFHAGYRFAVAHSLAQPEQEPVAWLDEEKKIIYWHNTHETDDYHGFKRSTPLYTTPPQRKPLTDEEIDRIWVPHTFIQATDRRQQAFARAIEAAHGIKGEA